MAYWQSWLSSPHVFISSPLHSKPPIKKKIILFVYLLLAVLGLCCCAGFSLVVAIRGDSLAAVRGLLIAVASLVGQHGL